MATASTVLSPAHLKLLRLVYDSFKETATWPPARKIRLAVRKDGELADLCREIGSDFITPAAGDRAEEKCELRVRSLVHLKGAERDVANLEAVIPFLVGRYIQNEGEATVSSLEFEQKLGMTEIEARRLVAWLHYAPRLVRNISPDLPERRSEVIVSPDILRLEGVTTFADYLKRTDELDEEQRRRWAEQQSSPPQALSRKGFRLGLGTTTDALGLDALQLHEGLLSQVEQLFLDGHHRQAVREGFTVFEARVREMVEARSRPGSKIPRGANLMAKAFNPENPIIRLSAGRTETEQNEQRGFQLLAQGAMAWPRNYLSHELPEMHASEALAWLALVGMLMKTLDAVPDNDQ